MTFFEPSSAHSALRYPQRVFGFRDFSNRFFHGSSVESLIQNQMFQPHEFVQDTDSTYRMPLLTLRPISVYNDLDDRLAVIVSKELPRFLTFREISQIPPNSYSSQIQVFNNYDGAVVKFYSIDKDESKKCLNLTLGLFNAAQEPPAIIVKTSKFSERLVG